jgi:pyocin large subunit-like protein
LEENQGVTSPAAETGALLAEVVAEALKADFGAIPSHVKHLARLTGTNERTVHNWLLARNGPSGTALVMLMRHSDAVTEAVLALAGRDEHSAAVRLVKVKNILRARALELVECLGPA